VGDSAALFLCSASLGKWWTTIEWETVWPCSWHFIKAWN